MARVNPIKGERFMVRSVLFWFRRRQVVVACIVTLMKILFYWRRQVNELFPYPYERRKTRRSDAVSLNFQNRKKEKKIIKTLAKPNCSCRKYSSLSFAHLHQHHHQHTRSYNWAAAQLRLLLMRLLLLLPVVAVHQLLSIPGCGPVQRFKGAWRRRVRLNWFFRPSVMNCVTPSFRLLLLLLPKWGWGGKKEEKVVIEM